MPTRNRFATTAENGHRESSGMTENYPLAVAFGAFALGLVTGLAGVYLVMQSQQSHGFSHYSRQLADKLGRGVTDALSQLNPAQWGR